MLTEVQKPVLISDAASEPVSLTEAKKHLELGGGSEHDDQLGLLIEAARNQWEHDTSTVMVSQAWRQYLDKFQEFRFFNEPVSAITSVAYYDETNSVQTLSTSVYDLDVSRNAIVVRDNVLWPGTYARWDAVTINYTVGLASVPAIAKQAMLLLIGHYFENRDMLMTDAITSMRAYENLVRRYTRSTYP